jgi:cell division protein ZapE
MSSDGSDKGRARSGRAAHELREAYQRQVRERGFRKDAAQLAAVDALEDVRTRLIASARSAPSGAARLLSKLRITRPAHAERGLYLWGGVGRGKTWLMDLFFQSLPFAEKRRRHFHRFMYDVHAQLKTLTDQQSPLEQVAATIADQTHVICFDEFFVTDIADAMILGTLFESLFRRGVSLVATSNVPPKDLYKEGLQRARFLPAIALLEQNTRVLAVDGGTDYRLRQLTQAGTYLQSNAPDTSHRLEALFTELSDGDAYTDSDPRDNSTAPSARLDNGASSGARAGAIPPNVQSPRANASTEIAASSGARANAGPPDTQSPRAPSSIEIEGRPIPIIRESSNTIWFDFEAICEGPRSQNDYIEIARDYQSVIVANVPRFTTQRENAARRFIALVDELYDHNVNLIVSAAAPPTDLYHGERLTFEFQRTVSRLIEMQTEEYLAREHRA